MGFSLARASPQQAAHLQRLLNSNPLHSKSALLNPSSRHLNPRQHLCNRPQLKRDPKRDRPPQTPQSTDMYKYTKS